MSIEIKFNLTNIRKKFNVIDDETKLFAHETFYRYMQPYVPYKTGTLYKSAEVTKDGVRFTQPYARFLYYGKLMVNDRGMAWARQGEKKHVVDVELNYNKEMHPLACARWGEAAWAKNKKNIAKEVKEYIRGPEYIGK